jgi:glutamate dehydrogenase
MDPTSQGDPLEALLEATCERVDPARRALFAEFARAFLRRLDPRQRGGERALLGRLLDFFELARQRAPGELRLRVVNPEERPDRSAIELLQDDRPFIVDSLRMLLRRRGFRERLGLHPVLAVRRAADGSLEAIGGEAGTRPESALYVEVSPCVAGAEGCAELESAILEQMRAVRDVTEDFGRMVRTLRELSAGVDFAARVIPGGRERTDRITGFLEWLIAGHFVLIGLRSYQIRRLEEPPGDYGVCMEPGSGLGLWRADSSSRFREPLRRAELPADLRDAVEDPRILIVDKSDLESHIHRPGHLDRIIVKGFDEDGNETGFAIIHGLFTLSALRMPSSQVPLLAERLQTILAEEGVRKGSHRHRVIFSAFDSAPVEVLLGTDIGDNTALIREIVESEGSKQTRIVLRAHRTGRLAYVAVLLPREHYAEALRGRIRRFLEERIDASYIDDRTSFIGEGTALLHYFCTSSDGPLSLPDHGMLESEIVALCASWEDRLSDALVARFGEVGGAALVARYESAFTEAFRERTDAANAPRDVEAMEELHASGLPQFAFSFDSRDPRRETTLLRIYLPEAMLVSDLLPLIDHFGIRVVDAQELRIRPEGRSEVAIETLRILPLGADQADLDALAPRLGEALRAALTGQVPNDALNRLVLGAGLDWRQVDWVRAYREYFLQVQGALTRAFLDTVLLQNPLAVRLLVQLAETRFDPALEDGARTARAQWLLAAFESYRDRIPALNEDRALAGICGLIEATLRTSYFAPAREPHRIAFKLDPERVSDLSGPQPYREIFVHSALMMGIHIRGGPVARGGLRWSDRSDDLRVEILELARTQMLKNGIIVPVGAKGGFVLKQSDLSPGEARSQADLQYRIFVESLLELTDNLDVEGRPVPPPGVHALDDPDPYLVVAADKGTAHLSDVANQVAKAHDFWLGDAFASGGSEGYDHKKYGITARGAWECVKHRLASVGIDPERDAYTMAGIGDMSGDVFGNGLLLARRGRLLAAFDHRDVFLDPDPDPEVAWGERQRLFELPNSTWGNYDAAKISEGGGVFPRAAKRIPLAPRVRERLGIAASHGSGTDVVRAILAMPVDLLWNGGIGTYVKASSERNADVGDRANDPVRIDASELRARVLGEGGNLGLTEAARVEAALSGVRLDTDAIDNSAGVDLSDHEVNSKLLLDPAVRSGALSAPERRAALFDVVEETCERTLAHNRGQALAISLDEVRSKRDLAPFARALEHWCEPPDVDPAELGLPDAGVLAERAERGQGLARPELAVLLGLAKLQTRQAVAASRLAEQAYLAPLYQAYFPEALRAGHAAAIADHRLCREITALATTNRLLDAGGVTLLPTLTAELGCDIPDVVAALLLAEDILEIPRWRAAVIGLGPKITPAATAAALLELDRGARDSARFLVLSEDLDLDAERVERRRIGLADLRAHQGEFLSESEHERARERAAGFAELGLPAELVIQLAVVPLADRGLNSLRVCESVPVPPLLVTQVYARLGEATGINWAYQRLPQVEAGDVWDSIVLVDLRWTLLDLQRELTERLLREKPDDPMLAVEQFVTIHAEELQRVRHLQERAISSGSASALSVVTQRLRKIGAGEEAAPVPETGVS